MKIKNRVFILLIVLTGYSMCFCQPNNTSEYKTDMKFIFSEPCNNCYNCFSINEELDPALLKSLNNYLYVSLISKEDKSCQLDSSFFLNQELNHYLIKMILSAYKHGVDFPEKFGEFYFPDRKIELLFNLENSINVLNETSNELLELNEDDGLIALWSQLDVQKLSNLDSYVNYSKDAPNNFFRLTNLVAVFHNSRHYDKRDAIMKEIVESEDFEESKEGYQLLEELISKGDFTYSEYLEVVYYGW